MGIQIDAQLQHHKLQGLKLSQGGGGQRGALYRQTEGQVQSGEQPAWAAEAGREPLFSINKGSSLLYSVTGGGYISLIPLNPFYDRRPQ